MGWHKAAGKSWFGSPNFHPCAAFLKIGQAFLPILVGEGPRISDRRDRISAIRFVVISAGVQPARRVRDELPLILWFVGPACRERLGLRQQTALGN